PVVAVQAVRAPAAGVTRVQLAVDLERALAHHDKAPVQPPTARRLEGRLVGTRTVPQIPFELETADLAEERHPGRVVQGVSRQPELSRDAAVVAGGEHRDSGWCLA